MYNSGPLLSKIEKWRNYLLIHMASPGNNDILLSPPALIWIKLQALCKSNLLKSWAVHSSSTMEGMKGSGSQCFFIKLLSTSIQGWSPPSFFFMKEYPDVTGNVDGQMISCCRDSWTYVFMASSSGHDREKRRCLGRTSPYISSMAQFEDQYRDSPKARALLNKSRISWYCGGMFDISSCCGLSTDETLQGRARQTAKHSRDQTWISPTLQLIWGLCVCSHGYPMIKNQNCSKCRIPTCISKGAVCWVTQPKAYGEPLNPHTVRGIGSSSSSIWCWVVNSMSINFPPVSESSRARSFT